MRAYQTSPTVEAARSWDRRYVDARDLFRMVAWKSAQGLASLTLNSSEGIEACTGHVIAIIEPYRDSDVFELRKDTGEWEAFLSVTERALPR